MSEPKPDPNEQGELIDATCEYLAELIEKHGKCLGNEEARRVAENAGRIVTKAVAMVAKTNAQSKGGHKGHRIRVAKRARAFFSFKLPRD